jgi:hypothetical protein
VQGRGAGQNPWDVSETFDSSKPPLQPPPHAFTQGVGTVFQFVGVILFLISMTICCGSGLFSKTSSGSQPFSEVGWKNYDVQRAVICSLMGSIVLGIALSTIGLGLQATRRWAPLAAVGITAAATSFFGLQVAFFISIGWILMAVISFVEGIGTVVLLMLAVGALREMRANPAQADQDVLPEGYTMPYSHLHEEPPEVRLARELAQRRRKLEIEQKELEQLERRLKRRQEEK